MARLTGPEIARQVELGNIKIEPYDEKWLGPNSYDLHMGDELFTYAETGRLRVLDPLSCRQVSRVIDSRNPPELVKVPHAKIVGGNSPGWLVMPGRLYFGKTAEITIVNGFVGDIDGRSSCGRLGVFAHITAGKGDDGWDGRWTLEVAGVEPVYLYPGDRLFQITFETIVGERKPYRGRYQGARGVEGSKIAQ